MSFCSCLKNFRFCCPNFGLPFFDFRNFFPQSPIAVNYSPQCAPPDLLWGNFFSIPPNGYSQNLNFTPKETIWAQSSYTAYQPLYWGNLGFSNISYNGSYVPSYNMGNQGIYLKTKKEYLATGTVDNSYSSLTKTQAMQKAATDSRLEKLSGGTYWSISEGSFKTDIPYARKGTSQILEEVAKKVYDELNIKLVITSALATGEPGNPHQKDGYASHHNAENPKLDIAINGDADKLIAILEKTGYFKILRENTHLDVQIKPEKYNELSVLS